MKNKYGKPGRTGATRWRFCLTNEDYRAIEYLQKKYLFGTLTNSLRYALRNQVERDVCPFAGLSTREQLNLTRIRDESADLLRKSRLYGPDELQLMNWSCWLHPEDFGWMDQVKQHWRFRYRAEALRFALRVQAERDGFQPQGGCW